MVAPNSTVLVAGRTLVAWTSFATEMSAVAREKNVCFKFLIASDQMQPYLDAKQVAQFKTDLPYARETFLDLVRKNPAQFHLRETDQLILDGITCVRVLLPGGETEPATRASKLLVLHDINAAAGDSKAAFLLACTCNRDGIEGDESCMAHGLLARTTLLYDRAARADAEVSAATQLLVHKEGISSRNNIPANYLYHVIPHLRCVESDAMKSVPPPLCVQVQISAKCSTHCRMCEHWKETASHQLDTQQWHTIFGDLAAFEVRTVVFSGGEPLTQEALPELLKSAVGAGLKVGLLTNGTLTEKSSDERRHVIDAIREFVSWVAVSIDGRPAEDEKIRNPLHTLEGRTALLKEFCTALKDKVPTSATVTLQSDNIQMDLREACRSIKEDLGVQNINFKLATGSTLALQKPVSFLLNQTELDGLVDFLWQNPLAQEGENNLDYLRRCFASGIFNIADAANGAPLQSFYKKDHRCYTPFLFSLIDSDGAVYPCCHLYRDNHSMDRKTREYRDKHRIGFAHETPFRYIWNSDAYALKRRELQKIDPDEPTFEPCGECTRHCQHNRALSQIQNEYAGRLDVLERLLANKPGSEDVWF
jgi:MoaA/NifB/PqqE/SkfB family radical SAM enzyme